MRTYVHWTLLRGARHRARTRPFTPGAGNWLRTRIRATLNFLTWLRQEKLTLATATQNAIDQWLTATPTDATYAAREFLYWVRKHGLAGEVSIPKKPHHSSLQPITEDERWTQLRRCLHEQTLPSEVRATGATRPVIRAPRQPRCDPAAQRHPHRPRRHQLAAAEPPQVAAPRRRRGTASHPTRLRHRHSHSHPHHQRRLPLAVPRRTTRPTRATLSTALCASTCPSTSAEPAAPRSPHWPPKSPPPSSLHSSTSTSTPPTPGPSTPNTTGRLTSRRAHVQTWPPRHGGLRR